MTATAQRPGWTTEGDVGFIDDPIEALAAIEAEIQKRSWQEEPETWIGERLQEYIWYKQREVLRSVQEHRRTAVRSCHEVGKSWLAGRIAAWWIDVWPEGSAFVVTTAPTGPQIKTILWKELGRAFVRGRLRGRVNQTEWYIPVKDAITGLEKEEIVAFGRKPDDYDPAAFQGIHARRVLVIIDEANGVRGPLHEAAESLIANDESKIVMIGNPDDPTGEFFDACKPGSGWNVVTISAFDSPNFTGEPCPLPVSKQLIGRVYVEEKRRKWAPHWRWTEDNRQCVPPDGVDAETDPNANPMWLSKICGVFPEKTEAGGLIPISWVKVAQLRDLSKAANTPNELGADIGAGGDNSAICHRVGWRFRIIRSDNDPNTMSQCGKIIGDLNSTGATCVKIDKIGIGWGVVERGIELKKPFIGINVGEGATENDAASSDERFLNLKAELWWNVRDLFERGLIDLDPDDDDTAAELLSIRYERMSNGKIKISDKKKDAQGRTLPSPNRAEAVMLAAAPGRLVSGFRELEIAWG